MTRWLWKINETYIARSSDLYICEAINEYYVTLIHNVHGVRITVWVNDGRAEHTATNPIDIVGVVNNELLRMKLVK